MGAVMQISFNGIETLKELEGFRAEAYKDTGGVWTIGYGTTRVAGIPVQQGQCTTQAEATLWLVSDCSLAQTAVNQSVRVPLRQSQFDALVSFTYNVGIDAFRKSTLLRVLNTGDHAAAAKQFARWVYDNGKLIAGLVGRREIERSMFES